jgi:transposase
MSTRFYDTDLTDATWAFVAPASVGGRPRTTSLRAVLNAIFYLLRTGQWRLLPREFHRVARSTITFKPGKTPVCGSSRALRAGPSSCRTSSLSIGGDHGWPIGQDDRAWWCSWFRRAQARVKGLEKPHLGRHTRLTGCQACRTG